MNRCLSSEGKEFLKDPVMYSALVEICAPVRVTPEDFLIRFEEILSYDPNAILGLFEK